MRLRLLSGGTDAISADELNQLLEVNPAVLSRWREDPAGFHPVWVSPNLATLTGWSAADMLGDRRWWSDNLHPEDRERVLGALATARSGERHALDYRFRGNDGDYRLIHDEFRVIEGIDGKPRALIRAWTEAPARVPEPGDDRVSAIADAMPFGVVISSFPEGRVLYLNAAAKRLTGYDDGAVNNSRTIDFYVEPSERARILAIFERNGAVPPMELHVRRRDGSTFWAMFSANRITVSGQPATLNGIYDIDQLKKTERELRATEQRFRAIADAAPFGLLITRWSDGRILYANEAAAGLSGYSPAGILARQSSDLYADPTKRDRYVEALKQEGSVRGIEFWARKPDGSQFWAAISARMIEFAGETAVLVGAYDISGQKRLEEALRDTEQRFRDYAECASDWYWEMDADLRFTWTSNSRERTTGFGFGEPVGKTRWELAGVDPSKEPWVQHRLDLLNRRPFRDFRYGYPGPDGRIRHYRVSGAPVFDRTGQFRGYRGVGIDETAYVEAEAKAAEAQARLAEALETTSQSMAVFDASDRLLLCSRKYKAAVDQYAPGLLRPGVTFEELVRGVAARGMYRDAADREAFVAKRMADHRDLPHEREHQLGDGTWLRAAEWRTASGGTAVVHTDITELKRVEQALRESEQRFRDFTETASDWWWETDANHRFTGVSDRHRRQLKLPPQNLLGRTRWDIVNGDPAEEPWRSHIADLEARRAFRDFRFSYTVADGRLLHIRISGKPIFAADGTFLGYRGVGTDETAKVEAEQRATAAQTQLAHALGSMSESLLLTDSDDKIVLWNRKGQELWDRLAPGEILRPGIPFEQLVREGVEAGFFGEVDDAEAYVAQRMADHRKAPSTREQRLRDGTWMQVSERRTRDGGTVVVQTDITARKQAENELREAERRFRDFAECASDWFWEMDADFRFTWILDGKPVVLPMTPQEAIGKTRWELVGANPATEPWRNHIDDLQNHRPFRDFRYTFTGPDGRTHYYRVNGKPIFDDAGGLVGYRGNGTNETAKVEAEKTARQSEVRLVEALESTSEAFSLLDADDRLVLWNRKYQELAERFMPGWLRVGVTFEEIVRESARSGLYFGLGDDIESLVQQRLAAHRTLPSVTEYQFADGSWMQVSQRRTADGGTVLVHTDVTEIKRRETELRLARQRFGDFAECASDWFWETDADLRFTWISVSKSAVLPIPTEHAIGRTRWEVVEADVNAEPWRSNYEDMLNRRPFRDFHYSYAGSDGRRHYYCISGVPVFDDAGRFLGYRGNGTDETARVEAERTAAQAHARLMEALESTSESFALFDAEDRLVLWNRKYEDMWRLRLPGVVKAGVTFEEIVRQCLRHGVYFDPGRDPEAFIRRRLEAHRNPPSIGEYHLGDGSWVQVGEQRTADGGIVMVQTDISEIKRREAELRKLSRAIEQSPSMVVITDTDGRIEYVNPKFSEITGYSRDETIGRTPAMLRSGSTPREIYKELWGTLLSGRDWVGEIRNHRKNGEPYWCRESISPLRDARGVITHYVAVEQDITAERQAEAELRAAKEQAEVANRAKSEFLANMSHELRTPLNAIIGFSEVIRNEMFGALGNERYRGYIDNILESGNHLLNVINDILDIAKIEAGKLVLNEDDLGLSTIGESVVRLILERARQGGLEVAAGIPESLPQLRADARLVKQILLNLLSNAVKFTGRGGRITLEGGQGADGGLWLSVADTGIGIAAADLKHIFEPFYQAETGNDRRYQGTGLGLPLCKRLAEAHGGRLDVDSHPGVGTTVTVRFPAERTRRS